MPDHQTVATVLFVGSLAIFLACYLLMLLLTRPHRVEPAPATQELPGAEPPAVVALLAGHWRVTDDAAEATLIDLAARRVLEFRQPGDDPAQTTVHVRDPNPAGLTWYERAIFDRVRTLAVNGTVPLTALTFRDESQAAAFAKRLHADIVADARARGLSRPRLSPAVRTLMTIVGAGAGAGVATATLLLTGSDPVRVAGGTWLMATVLLNGLVHHHREERDTPAGHQAARRWLAVRDWLRNTESFADLPPAAVAVWDRYLSYGDALGVTRACAAVIDLGMGDRRRVWSSFGGTWHRIRVHYPRFWPRYGHRVGVLVGRGVAAGAVGGGLLYLWGSVTHKGLPVLLVPALLLLAYGVYVLVRTLVDVAIPRTLTGQVLWVECWRVAGDRDNPRPWLHHLAVDDGTGDETTAWGLPSELAGQVHDTDTVTITVRRWSRRVVDLTVLAGGPGSRAAATPADRPGDNPLSSLIPAQLRAGLGMAVPPSVHPTASSLVSTDEVVRAVGRPVMRAAAPTGGTGRQVMHYWLPNGAVALELVLVTGPPAHRAIGGRRGGQPLPGIGDEAYTGAGWAVARRGDTVVLLELSGPLRTSTDPRSLPWLLSTAVGRLPATLDGSHRTS